jgi:hypothetical protein
MGIFGTFGKASQTVHLSRAQAAAIGDPANLLIMAGVRHLFWST